MTLEPNYPKIYTTIENKLKFALKDNKGLGQALIYNRVKTCINIKYDIIDAQNVRVMAMIRE